jgi:L-2,4-diaminobutyric acid acetyltransferase
MNRPTTAENLLFDRPAAADGAAVHRLIRDCPPLDCNTTYAYMLLCRHFAETCVLARGEIRDEPLGFLSAYLVPQRPDTLFVWQVAVHRDARGLGLAGRMLDDLLARPAHADVRFVETTISPSNRASIALFESFARRIETPIESAPFILEQDFGGEQHEAEDLYRLGPIPTRSRI